MSHPELQMQDALRCILDLMERADVPSLTLVLLLRRLRVAVDDLRAVPIGVQLAKIAKGKQPQQGGSSGQDELRAEARACKAEWAALLLQPHRRPPRPSVLPAPSARQCWRLSLQDALHAVKAPESALEALARSVEEGAYRRCAAVGGDPLTSTSAARLNGRAAHH